MSGDLPRSVVVTVGSELLLGRPDDNTRWLAVRLSENGVPLLRASIVGDDESEIREAVGEAKRRAPLVIVTGGLGPTPDDVTREAVASLTLRPLREDPDLLDALVSRFRERGYDALPEANRKTALVPEGARILPNPRGTVPGLVLEDPGSMVVLLPGVPAEMQGLFDEEVSPVIEARFGERRARVLIRSYGTTGIAESALADRLRVLPLLQEPILSLAFLPHRTGVEIRVIARGRDVEAAAALDRIEERLLPLLAPHLVATDGRSVAEVLVDTLAATGGSVAVAESCTGGEVQARLTDVPGASRVFPGGVVAYADSVKTGWVGVDPSLLHAHGAVSEEVARALARGVRDRFGTSFGIGVTGVAGPGGGSPEKPVGTVWIAVSTGDAGPCERHRFHGDREAVRVRTAQAALHLALRVVQGGLAI